MHETTVKCFACSLVKRVIVVRWPQVYNLLVKRVIVLHWPQVYNFTGETCSRCALASGIRVGAGISRRAGSTQRRTCPMQVGIFAARGRLELRAAVQ